MRVRQALGPFERAQGSTIEFLQAQKGMVCLPSVWSPCFLKKRGGLIWVQACASLLLCITMATVLSYGKNEEELKSPCVKLSLAVILPLKAAT